MRAAAVALLVGLAACAAPVTVPDPDLEGMEPQVAELLRRERQAVVDRPGSADRWGALGTAHDAHGLFADAERCYRRAHELAPGEFRWIYLLATAREIQGAEIDEVVSLFGRAERIRPDYAPIQIRLGDALSLRGDHAGAERAYRRAVDLDAQSAVAVRGLGQALLALGSAEAAVATLERAIALEPRDLAARAALAQALMRVGRTDEARRVTERSRALKPVSVVNDPVWAEQVFGRSVSSSRAFARALARIRDGQLDEAVADLTLVLAARPDDASAHYWIGTAHADAGRPDPAVEHLSRAVDLEPTLVRARVRLAGLLAAQGKRRAAAQHYSEALRLAPEDAKALEGLAGLGD